MTWPKPSFDDYLQWLLIEKGRSRATTEAYRRDLERFETWMVSQHTSLSALSDASLERYVDGLRAANLAPSSVARAVSCVRGWMGFLVEEGLLDHDPASRLRGGRVGKTLPKPLAESEMATLLDAIVGADRISLRDRALLEVLYGTGARVSEAVGIALEDLDFDEELILVTGKGSKQRLVPMGASVRSALERYLAPGGRGEFTGGSRGSSVFLNARGGPLSRQGVDLIVRKRALESGIARSRISAHVFRHSCATHMLAHGADIRVVQELLGHASISTTQIYTAVSATSLQREYLNAHPRAHG